MSAKATPTVRGELVRDVHSVSEFKEVKRHANALSLSIHAIEAFGSWDSAEGHPVFPAGSVEIEKAGRKYFHMVLDGDVVPVQPADGAGGSGKLRLTLKKQTGV